MSQTFLPSLRYAPRWSRRSGPEIVLLLLSDLQLRQNRGVIWLRWRGSDAVFLKMAAVICWIYAMLRCTFNIGHACLWINYGAGVWSGVVFCRVFCLCDCLSIWVRFVCCTAFGHDIAQLTYNEIQSLHRVIPCAALLEGRCSAETNVLHKAWCIQSRVWIHDVMSKSG